MKIVFCEIFSATHLDPLKLKIRALTEVGGWEIIVIGLQQFENEFNNLPVKFLLCKERDLSSAVKQIRKLSPEVVFFTTFIPNFNIIINLFKLRKYKLLISIQNASLWFGSTESKNVRYIVKKLLCNYAKQFFSCYFVGLKEMQSYVIDVSNNKYKVNVTPFSLPSYSNNPVDNNKITVVVPGIYSSKRRDYFGLLKFIGNNPDMFNTDVGNFKMIFLGAPTTSDDGQKIFGMMVELKRMGYDISYFDRFVTKSVFVDNMRCAHFILSPVNVTGHQHEIYGKTKDTGAFWDMLKYDTMGYVPKGLIIPDLARHLAQNYASYECAFELMNVGAIRKRNIMTDDEISLMHLEYRQTLKEQITEVLKND
jgi:hypothetical protein